jgi:hypothetical protein
MVGGVTPPPGGIRRDERDEPDNQDGELAVTASRSGAQLMVVGGGETD